MTDRLLSFHFRTWLPDVVHTRTYTTYQPTSTPITASGELRKEERKKADGLCRVVASVSELSELASEPAEPAYEAKRPPSTFTFPGYCYYNFN